VTQNKLIDQVNETPGKIWSEETLLDCLENTYKFGEGWCCLRQVRNDAGHRAKRSADGLMIGLWPSRGHDITGFEVKVTRSDFLREMKDPMKAEAIAQHCDFWYIVAPPGMIKKDELPEFWGLMIPSKTKLRIVKRAKQLGMGAERRDLPRGFVAAMMKRFVERCQKDFDPRKERDAGFADGHTKGYAMGLKEAGTMSKFDHGELERFREATKAFKEATGISFFGASQIGDIGEEIKFLRRSRVRTGFAGQIKIKAESLRTMATEIEKMANLFEDESEPSALATAVDDH